MQKSKRVKKGHNSTMTNPTEKKKIQVLLFFMHIPYIKFQDPISTCSWPYAKSNRQMDAPSTALKLWA